MTNNLLFLPRRLRLAPLALSLTFLICFSPTANSGDFAAKARVISSAPIIETVYEPVEECRYEYRSAKKKKRDDTGDRLAAGVAGGLAGSAVGKGSGRDAAAALGAIIGSEVADDDEGLTEGELLGGIAGGIIGNQVGKGSGKTAATALGALAGATIGSNLQEGNKPQSASKKRKVKVCDTVEREKKIVTGYDVTYEYQGRQSRGVLPYEPGEFVIVNVAVDLVEEPR
jgi:uncharacterized protein YcfJ